METLEQLLTKAKALNEKKEYEVLIKDISEKKLQEHRCADLYSEVAQAYWLSMQYNLSEAASDSALSIDPQNVKANHYKGNAYYFSGKYDDALTAFKKAIAVDPTFPRTYNSMGNAYREIQKYDDAILAYKMAIALEPLNSIPYNGLGNIYKALKQYEESIQFYNKAIELNQNYDDPYYNRARLYMLLEKYELALLDYEKFVGLVKNSKNEYYIFAKSDIEQIKNILKDDDYENIMRVVNSIKDKLYHGDGCVTHYTSLSTASKLILNKSTLRLSEGAFLNDSSEGRVLFEFLEINHTNVSSQINSTQSELFSRRPFIGSYVQEGLNDELTLWRMYGKENKEEAKGCAITIDAKEMVQRIKDKLVADGKAASNDDIDEDLKFYQVAYKQQLPFEAFFIPGANAKKQKELNLLMKDLKARVNAYIKKKKQNEKNINRVLEQLNSIAYLFKSTAYQHEHELRLVVKGLRFTKVVDSSNSGITPPWVYIELVEVIPLIRKLTLGPKVDKKDEWASAFYYSIMNDPSRKDELPLDIFISHLPFK